MGVGWAGWGGVGWEKATNPAPSVARSFNRSVTLSKLKQFHVFHTLYSFQETLHFCASPLLNLQRLNLFDRFPDAGTKKHQFISCVHFFKIASPRKLAFTSKLETGSFTVSQLHVAFTFVNRSLDHPERNDKFRLDVDRALQVDVKGLAARGVEGPQIEVGW